MLPGVESGIVGTRFHRYYTVYKNLPAWGSNFGQKCLLMNFLLADLND